MTQYNTDLEDEENDDLTFKVPDMINDMAPINGNNNNNNNDDGLKNKEFDMFDVIKEADSISQEIHDSINKSLADNNLLEKTDNLSKPESGKTSPKSTTTTTTNDDVVKLHPIYISQKDEFNHPSVGPTLGLIPRSSYYFDVILEECNTPSNFYVRSYRTSKLLDTMQKEMKDFYVQKYRQESLQMDNLMLNGYYVLKKDNKYFRVKIRPPFNRTSEKVMVEKLDYGGFVQVEPKQLLPLNKTFLTLPTQAWKAKLQVPSWPTNPRWSPEECTRFRTEFEGKSLVALILGEEIDCFTSERCLGCVLVDTSGSKDNYIHVQFSEKQNK